MKNILIPTDRSDLGDYAYQLAAKIAEKTGAGIDVLSVIPAPPNVIYDARGNIKNDDGKDLSKLEQEKASVEAWLADWTSSKAHIQSTTVKIGDVEEDIIHCIKAKNIDLVVMGTTGAREMKELLRGSHAGHIAQESPVPVVSLKCDRSDMVLNDILLVSDFKSSKTLKLEALKELQKVFDARLNLLKVNTPSHFVTTRQARANMQAFVERNELQNVAFHVYCDDSVEKGIYHFSYDQGIDFVAMENSYHHGLNRFFKHNVAIDAVNHLMQPIMTFPHG